MMSSTIIPSAKPPEKHMPTAPTPGPPTSLWTFLASARSQAMTGDVLFNAIVVNSLAMQIFIIDCATESCDDSRSGEPTNDGITTVKPRSTTSLANCATVGVMPGISWITNTAGPLPRRYVGKLISAALNSPSVQPARTPERICLASAGRVGDVSVIVCSVLVKEFECSSRQQFGSFAEVVECFLVDILVAHCAL